MKLEDGLFWVSAIITVILSYYISQIDPLLQIIYGGYYGFITGSFVLVNPAFVFVFLFVLQQIFANRYQDFYIQFGVNSMLIWLEVIPAFYLNQFYDIKSIVIGFCILDIILALFLCNYIRKWLKISHKAKVTR